MYLVINNLEEDELDIDKVNNELCKSNKVILKNS